MFKQFKEKQAGFGNFRFWEVIIIMVVSVSFGIASVLFIVFPYFKGVEPITKMVYNPDSEEIMTVMDLVLDNYYKDVNKAELKEAAIKGMLNYLGDSNTYYFSKEEKNDFDERMQGEYYGIGIELITDIDNNVIVLNVFADSPAAEAGLKIGDLIIKIDEQNTKEMTSAEIAAYIKEGQAESVDIEIDRNGKKEIVKVEKRKVIIESISYEIIEEKNKKIGYLDVIVFANNTYEQFREAVLDLEEKGVSAFIIDVRSNAGGYLDAVVDMVEMFLPKEEVIYQMELNDNATVYRDRTEEARELPVVVLINEQSASASEILAAAFKEVYGAEIVGVTSYGKGTVQETRDLDNGGMIKITTQKWLTPEGNLIEKEGIEPTVKIELNDKYYFEPIKANDNQLQKALSLLIK